MDSHDLHEEIFLTPTLSDEARADLHLLTHGKVLEAPPSSAASNQPSRIRTGITASTVTPTSQERENTVAEWQAHGEAAFARSPVSPAPPPPKVLPRHSLDAEPRVHDDPGRTPHENTMRYKPDFGDFDPA